MVCFVIVFWDVPMNLFNIIFNIGVVCQPSDIKDLNDKLEFLSKSLQTMQASPMEYDMFGLQFYFFFLIMIMVVFS